MLSLHEDLADGRATIRMRGGREPRTAGSGFARVAGHGAAAEFRRTVLGCGVLGAVRRAGERPVPRSRGLRVETPLTIGGWRMQTLRGDGSPSTREVTLMSQPWSISGEYMEACSCSYLCPCITSNATAPATE